MGTRTQKSRGLLETTYLQSVRLLIPTMRFHILFFDAFRLCLPHIDGGYDMPLQWADTHLIEARSQQPC